MFSVYSIHKSIFSPPGYVVVLWGQYFEIWLPFSLCNSTFLLSSDSDQVRKQGATWGNMGSIGGDMGVLVADMGVLGSDMGVLGVIWEY